MRIFLGGGFGFNGGLGEGDRSQESDYLFGELGTVVQGLGN